MCQMQTFSAAKRIGASLQPPLQVKHLNGAPTSAPAQTRSAPKALRESEYIFDFYHNKIHLTRYF